MANRRFEDVEAHLHPDVVFESPALPGEHGATAFVDALWRLAPVIARHDVHRVFAEEDEVCAFYDFVTTESVGNVASVERLTFREGRIVSIYLLFDKARWPGRYR